MLYFSQGLQLFRCYSMAANNYMICSTLRYVYYHSLSPMQDTRSCLSLDVSLITSPL